MPVPKPKANKSLLVNREWLRPIINAVFVRVLLLVQETLKIGNILDLIVGFIIGAAAFGWAQHFIKHPSSVKSGIENNDPKRIGKVAGRVAVVGTILDSVPETLFIGIIIALHEPGLSVAVAVLFLGNFAATLEAAKIMHNQGLTRKKILRDWLVDFFIVALAAPLGYFLAKTATPNIIALVLSFATGTLIVFIAGELIARAYRESTGHYEDLAISLGFLIGVILLFSV